MLTLKIKGTAFPNIPLLEKMAGVKVEFAEDLAGLQGVGFLVRTQEMFVVLEGLVNLEEEIEKAQKELDYLQKFLAGVRGKLANERFVANAPAAVIANERKKESDALSKIESLEEKLKSLKKS
jgi:valyl-tRNA synthetase